MSVNDYAEKVVKNFITDITDHVFCNIERDNELMREYMDSVNLYQLEAVNTTIGKKVRELLNLKNTGENNNPKSRLIKSYTKHETP
jgi:hypothetical protein